MYDEILENLEKQVVSNLERIKNSNLHLGVFGEPYLSYMLEGKKKIESRFSKNKIAPYKQITKDDVVIIKKSSGNIVGYFTIKEVLFFDLRNTAIAEIKTKYGRELCVTEEFWDLKRNSNYATLIVIDEIVQVKPFPIDKKGMQSWIKLKRD